MIRLTNHRRHFRADCRAFHTHRLADGLVSIRARMAREGAGMRSVAVAIGLGVGALLASLLTGGGVAGPAPARSPALPRGLARTLSRREYEASPNAEGLQAPNRARGLGAYFEQHGLTITHRTARGTAQ